MNLTPLNVELLAVLSNYTRNTYCVSGSQCTYYEIPYFDIYPFNYQTYELPNNGLTPTKSVICRFGCRMYVIKNVKPVLHQIRKGTLPRVESLKHARY